MKVELNLPPGVELTRVPDKSLSDMLAFGELDCVIIACPPDCFAQGHPDIRRLYPDYQAMDRNYYAATGVWPIMHMIAMKRSVLREHPWAARNLMTAFTESKRRSVERLMDAAISRYPLAWLPAHARRAWEAMNGDPFPFGVEANRPTWERLLLYTYQQGIAHRHAALEDIFPPGMDDRVIV